MTSPHWPLTELPTGMVIGQFFFFYEQRDEMTKAEELKLLL